MSKPVNRRRRYRPACFSGKRWHPLKAAFKHVSKRSTRPHGVR